MHAATAARPLRGRNRWLIPASFFAAAFIVFGPSIGGDYVFDGVTVVRDNPLLSPFDPAKIATLDWWAGMGKPGGLYRPVALVWLAALRAVGGASPAAIDFANVLLQAIVAWLRFLLLVRLIGPRAGGADGRAAAIAWLAAMFALVHPIGVEIVAGQVGASDLLATALGTVAVLVGARGRPRDLVIATVVGALAVLSKESAVAIIPMALLFEALRPPGAEGRARRVLRAAAWSLLSVAIALACRAATIGLFASADDPVYAGFSGVARVASAFATFGTWTLPMVVAPWRQLAVPSHQDIAPASGFGDLRVVAGILLLLALVAAPALAPRSRRREVAFGCFFFVSAWLPTSNLLFSTGAIAASRFLYPGLIGIMLVVAAGVIDGWSSGGVARVAAAVVAAWFGIVMTVVTFLELPAWRSYRDLLELQVARAPRSAYGLVDLGSLLRDKDPGRADLLFAAVVASEIPNVPGSSYPPEDLLESVFIAKGGAALIAEQRSDNAAASDAWSAAERVAARGIEAAAALPYRENWSRHRAHAIRQMARMAMQRALKLPEDAKRAELARAGQWLIESESLDPGTTATIELRALHLQLRGEVAAKRAMLEKSLESRPDDLVLRALWAQELRAMGRSAEALALEIAVIVDAPGSVDAQRALVTARDAASSSDAAVREKGRRALSWFVEHATDRAVAIEAQRALSTASKR